MTVDAQQAELLQIATAAFALMQIAQGRQVRHRHHGQIAPEGAVDCLLSEILEIRQFLFDNRHQLWIASEEAVCRYKSLDAGIKTDALIGQRKGLGFA